MSDYPWGLGAAGPPESPRVALDLRPDVLCPVEVHVHDSVVTKHQRSKKQSWIDLDRPDSDNYFLIDDKYELLSQKEWEEDSDDPTKLNFDLVKSYPLANSHDGEAYREPCSSHNKYTESYSKFRENHFQNDHNEYEIANSHSNYKVFYDSENRHFDPIPERSFQKKEPDRDIERCLVQIEESLFNIEQNLLHVQDLDLLCQSPSVERKLDEEETINDTEDNVCRIRENPFDAETEEIKSLDKVDDESSQNNFEKRKRRRKKLAVTDNAIVPSKLISLSLSLLLAALLQAVRCLTDLVEDAFKSVSYDRTGLLQ